MSKPLVREFTLAGPKGDGRHAQLGVPVENVLGISALESGWGDSRFATQGNNYFGIHYPAPFATGYLVAGQSGVRVATFANYTDSLRSFAAISGNDVQGVSNPRDFAAALYDSGKFGVGSPNYADDVGKTIEGIRAIVSQHKS